MLKRVATVRTQYTPQEMVDAFVEASGAKVPYEIVARRAGDLPAYYADASLARELIGWSAVHDINRMCGDTWRWQSQNPLGYP